jgi:YfiH family protein
MPLVSLGSASVAFTGCAEGDLGSLAERGAAGPSPEMEARRRRLVDLPWTWLRQVHGPRVVVVSQPGDRAGEEADGAVSAVSGVALAILTADCAPIAFGSPEGVIGAAHAGWRGLAEGVIGETVAAMRGLGATDVRAVLGPCIESACYEFSAADLDDVAARLGDGVRATTRTGTPALDLPGGVRAALAREGVELAYDAATCTSCAQDNRGEPLWFSHRARKDEARQAMVVWCP